jgi:hypothetical protein
MLGWNRERIVVIDEDQGKSGAVPQSRGGFGGMVTAVARGEGGIVNRRAQLAGVERAAGHQREPEQTLFSPRVISP